MTTATFPLPGSVLPVGTIVPSWGQILETSPDPARAYRFPSGWTTAAAVEPYAAEVTLPAVDYEVRVYVMRTWATGAPRRTGTRTFTVREQASILGCARAIDAAVDQCGGRDLCDVHSPDVSPNPAELGWPIGLPAVTA